jgi:hypothetical protein
MEVPKKMSAVSNHDLTIYKVHVLDSNANTKRILVFGSHYVDANNVNTLFSDIEWQEITDKNISILYSDFLLYKDDSIGTVKKKIIHTIGLNQIGYNEMYLFTLKPESINLLALYYFLTENDTVPITPVVLKQLFYNFRMTDSDIQNVFLKIGEKENYSFDDLQEIFQEDKSYVFATPLGMRFLEKTDFLFSANPFQLFRDDDNTTAARREMTGLLREQYSLASFENELLLNYSNSYENNIYLCLTEDVLSHTESLSIDEEHIIKTYFPLLYIQDGIRTLDDFQGIRQKLLKDNVSIVNDKLLTVYRSISMLYDVYYKRTEDIPYLKNGIEEIELKIKSDLHMQIPLEVIFKNIHSSIHVPFVKYNPGIRNENIYRFYTEQQTNSGKNIPYLTENVIMRLSKEIGKSNEIALYISYVDPVSPQIEYSVYVTIQMNGNVFVKTSFSSPISLEKATEILKKAVNPVFQEINKNVEQHVFHLIDHLQSNYIEIVDLKYVLILNIDKEIKVNKYAGCITSVFDIMNIDEHYNIYLRFKRVENFKEMNAIQNMILNAFKHVNKNMDDISYVVNELMKNYGISEEAANNAILQFLGEHKDVGGEMIDNPGFDVFIQNRLDNKVRIEVNHVISTEYLSVLFVYLDTIIRMSQFPEKTSVNKKDFFNVCTKVEQIDKKGKEHHIENVITTHFEPTKTTAIRKKMKPIGYVSESESDSESDTESDVDSVNQGIFYGEEEENEDIENIEKTESAFSETPSSKPLAFTPSQLVPSHPPEKSTIQSPELGLGLESESDVYEKVPTIPKIRTAVTAPITSIAKPIATTSSSSSSSSSDTSSSDKGIFYDEEEGESHVSVEKVESPSRSSSTMSSTISPSVKKGGNKMGGNEIDNIDNNGPMDENERNQLEFMKKKIIGKPIKFLDNLKAKDPPIFAVEKDENYEGYARKCQRKHQPIALSKEEYDKLDKSTITEAVRYGSDPNRPNYYVCPRYWCLLTNTSMTLEDVKAGKCAKEGVPDKIIPTGETVIPKDAFVYDFTDNGKLNFQYPGFQTGIHPKGLCLPCCFKKPNQGKKECHQPEKEDIEDRNELISKTSLNVPTVKTRNKIVKAVIQEDETVAAEKEGNINYIISNETFPIKQKNRFGFLPFSIQLFLQTDNTKVVTKDNPAIIRPNVDCFLRFGVEQYKNKSILGCIVTLYAAKHKLTEIPSVNDFLFKIIPDAVGIDEFIQYHNGNLVSIFKSKDRKTVQSKEVDFGKYENSLFFKKINIDNESQYAFFQETVDAYENYIHFLQDPASNIDHTYIWDLIVDNNPKLIKGGVNLVILDIVNNDITDKIEIICPTHSKYRIFDSQKESFFLIKKGKHYEPIVHYKKIEEGILVQRTFSSTIPFKNIQKTLQTIDKMKNKYCASLSSMPTVYKFKKNIDVRELVKHIEEANWHVSAQIINYQGKTIGLLAKKTPESNVKIFVPCNPSSVLPESNKVGSGSGSVNIESIWMDENDKLWVDYKTTVQLLKEIKENSGGKILSQPKLKVLEDHLIVGVLTETNQFVQIMPPSENIEPDELPSVSSDNWNTADKTLMTRKEPDTQREDMIRNIKLESQFYHQFRKFIREHMNLYENRIYKEKIVEMVENVNYLYKQKLKKIMEWLKEMMQDKIVFEEIPIELLKEYENISCDSNRCKGTTETEPETKYCIQKEDGFCQFIIPKKHLISQLNNEEVYYGRIADELIRYNRIRIFMTHPKKYLNVTSGEYKISDNEFILLQSVLTPEYFKDLNPYNIHSYVTNTNYSTALPQITQPYANEMISMQEQMEETESETDQMIRKLSDCIKGKIDIIGNAKDSMWKRIFPKNAKEIEFRNTTPNCSFSILIYIFHLKYHKEITVTTIRRSLSVKYSELFKKYDKKILEIWKKSGKNRIVHMIKEKKATVETVIMSDEYYLTDLDIWIFSVLAKLQICIFNRNLLKGLNEKIEWLITNNQYDEAHYFIRSPALKGANIIPSYHFVTPPCKINELKEFESIVQNAISGRNVEYQQNVESIVEFLNR